jgi:signal transduction histidine kinase
MRAEISLEGVPLSPKVPWATVTNAAALPVLASTTLTLGMPSKTVGGETEEFFPSKPSIRVRVFLTDSEALFANQRLRSWLFAGFLLAATGTSALGVRNTVRTIREQTTLAEQKANFVSSVSHELRAPIASVRLLAESLERGAAGAPERQKEYHQLIVGECRRLTALVENVLDVTRIDQGRSAFDFEPTDLPRLTREAVRLMTPLAAEARTQLRCEIEALQNCDTPLPTPNLDGNSLLRALLNLIDNAIKHSPPGSQVCLRLQILSSPPRARWMVEDQGPGVPIAEREKIFDRFHRLGSELRRETPGVGLGLAIVRHTAEAHHGKVWVEDAPDRGSRFILEIPCIPCPES